MSNASPKRVMAAAKILRDAVYERGLGPHQTAQEILDADDAAQEYEYAVNVRDGNGFVRVLNEMDWYTLYGAENLLRSLSSMWEWQGINSTAKIVKRRKAGGIEDV